MSALYQGVRASNLGIIPYAGVDLAVYVPIYLLTRLPTAIDSRATVFAQIQHHQRFVDKETP